MPYPETGIVPNGGGVLSCPFYLNNVYCTAHQGGLYVPPKEVELRFCSTRDGCLGCRLFILEMVKRKSNVTGTIGEPSK